MGFYKNRDRTMMAGRLSMAVLFAMVSGAAATAQPTLDFNRDVRPILSDNCFQCHGPDANQRKAYLALHIAESAYASGAVVPEKPGESELVARIRTTDPVDQMPPPENELLPDRGGESDARTVDRRGRGVILPHWAFIPVPDTPAPELDSNWVRNPIDAFVLQRLRAEGIGPAPEADRETLLRRVTLDLTGLPPTIPEIDAFMRDDTEGAYERVVDRLLGSTAHAERLAQDWLDAAPLCRHLRLPE